MNATPLGAAGAALMFREGETSAAELAQALRDIISSPARRAQMAAAARSQGRPGAAAMIVDHCLSLMKELAASKAGPTT
jgi:UDP-N-acetylglucosamine:LPS N-acetylglucosamine transferase